MKYLVSCECSTYEFWQLELLLESFNKHNMQDNLIIALANLDLVDKRYTSNFYKHPGDHIYLLDNYGEIHGHRSLNKMYAAYVLLKNEKITQPFCLIEPDMVLYKPITIPEEQISFQIDSTFTKQYLEDQGIKVSADLEAMLKAKNIPDIEQWFPVGHVYVFNGAPIDLFEEVIKWVERLRDEHNHWDVGRAAWARAFMDWYGHLSFRNTHEYEMTLLSQGLQHNFIHYKHGLPPMFHKHMYKFDSPMILGPDCPYQHFLDNNPTTATNYMQKLVKSYLEKDA